MPPAPQARAAPLVLRAAPLVRGARGSATSTWSLSMSRRTSPRWKGPCPARDVNARPLVRAAQAVDGLACIPCHDHTAPGQLAGFFFLRASSARILRVIAELIECLMDFINIASAFSRSQSQATNPGKEWRPFLSCAAKGLRVSPGAGSCRCSEGRAAGPLPSASSDF
jgi:hypothetical protein